MGVNATAQRKLLPDTILYAFSEKYPTATDVKYKAKKVDYQIRFIDEEHQRAAIYSYLGRWIRTETTLKKKEIPEKVNNVLEMKHPNGYYTSGIMIELSNGRKYYQASLDSPNAILSIEIDESGKILKTEKHEKQKIPPLPKTSKTDGGEKMDNLHNTYN